MAGVKFGSKVATWDYGNIAGIALNLGFAQGWAAVEAGGLQNPKSHNDAAQRHSHSIGISFSDFEQARSGVALIRQLVANAQSGDRRPPATQRADGSTELLAKLAELRDAGVLTEEEFADKKRDVLSRM
jgi:hypothetical protein